MFLSKLKSSKKKKRWKSNFRAMRALSGSVRGEKRGPGSLAALVKAASWRSPVHWSFGHLAIAEMQAKVINVASWLRHNKLPLAAQMQMKSDCFLSDKPSSCFRGLRKGQRAPGSQCWWVCEHLQWHASLSGRLYGKVCITGFIQFVGFRFFWMPCGFSVRLFWRIVTVQL